MRSILARLETILSRLLDPSRLSAEEVGFLAREWGEGLVALEQFPVADLERCSAGEQLYLRTWLQRLLRRMPEVQAVLVAHKADVAAQLFSENRRAKALHSQYAVESLRPSQWSHKA
ncbi:MAG: hypothetical protein HQM04_08560 [Magnetococcales bacterium]|nr:hypothetical protein [Magnetococcales bacterium]MBF0115083.1 hypothetical protein [Magnetococcales bacterium]